MNQAPMSSDVTSDDKLWAALGYPIFIVAIVMLLMDDKKSRPFIKYHAVQSLAINVVLFLVSIVLGITVVLALCAPLLWLVTFYWAYLAYQGQMFTIPMVTDFIKKQGWV